GDASQGGRFAAAARPEQTTDRAPFELERKPVHRGSRAESTYDIDELKPHAHLDASASRQESSRRGRSRAPEAPHAPTRLRRSSRTHARQACPNRTDAR